MWENYVSKVRKKSKQIFSHIVRSLLVQGTYTQPLLDARGTQVQQRLTLPPVTPALSHDQNKT